MFVKPYEDVNDKHGSGRFFRTVSGEWTFTEDEDYVVSDENLHMPVDGEPLAFSSNSLNEAARKTLL